jgi:hypothetical protein
MARPDVHVVEAFGELGIPPASTRSRAGWRAARWRQRLEFGPTRIARSCGHLAVSAECLGGAGLGDLGDASIGVEHAQLARSLAEADL